MCFCLAGIVKRKILVLDLDETLIHSHHDGVAKSIVRPGTPSDFILKVTIDRHPVRFYVHKRPHVDFFLDIVSQWYVYYTQWCILNDWYVRLMRYMYCMAGTNWWCLPPQWRYTARPLLTNWTTTGVYWDADTTGNTARLKWVPTPRIWLPFAPTWRRSLYLTTALVLTELILVRWITHSTSHQEDARPWVMYFAETKCCFQTSTYEQSQSRLMVFNFSDTGYLSAIRSIWGQNQLGYKCQWLHL